MRPVRPEEQPLFRSDKFIISSLLYPFTFLNILLSNHYLETTTVDAKSETAALVNRKTLATLPGEQSLDIQGALKTHLDLWHRAVGLRATIQYQNLASISI
jgi:hypothetical protein